MVDKKTKTAERKEVNITRFFKFENKGDSLTIVSCKPIILNIKDEEVKSFEVIDEEGDTYILPTHTMLQRKINILISGGHDFEKENVEIVFNEMKKNPSDATKKIADFSVFTLMVK